MLQYHSSSPFPQTFPQTHLIFICFPAFVVVVFFLGSPVKSPRKSPVQLSMVTSSFYGQNKPIYLTPLERKAIKDLLPSPPRLPPSPPPQEKKKKNVKGGSKKRKVAAASRKAGKTGAVGNASSSKTIKLSKLNSRLVPILVTVAALLVLLQLCDTKSMCHLFPQCR